MINISNFEQEIDLLHRRVCYALADPKRILILYLLAEQGRFVNEIAEAMNIPQSTVSRHLRVLRERELVHAERDGTTILYTLTDRRIIEVIDMMRAILSTQLAADAGLIQSPSS